MAGTAPQIRELTTDETRNISVDMSGLLDDGEVLVGAPTIECSDSLTVDNEQINTAAVVINGDSVAVGCAVQFTVASTVRGAYTIDIKCSTDANQVVEGIIKIAVKQSAH